MAKSVLQVKNLSKKIRKKTIVQNINFEISAGEVFGLIGPNGAGKTTVIRSIVSLISRTSGSVMINGLDISVDYRHAISEVGAIIENPEFYMYLSGWDNLKQYARMSLKAVSDDDIKAVVAKVKLTEAINQKVKTYSLGMRQRLGLAQALLHKPAVLILDEPTNGLDPQGMAEFREIIRSVSAQGTGVLISSHILTEIQQITDRFAIIDKGQITHIETINDIEVKAQGKQLIKVGDSLAASKCLGHQNIEASILDEHMLEVLITEADVPAMLRHLILAEIDVYQIGSKKGSLEERFFELTDGRSL